MSELAHDPGGKRRLPLQNGVLGWAEFSECGKYRHVLFRNWGGYGDPSILWIGMNPSTAAADVDDPTIRKEMHFSRTMGFTNYVKANVMDFRTSYPTVLLSVEPRSNENLSHITYLSCLVDRIICAWGALPKPLQRYADDVVHALRDHKLYCMGKTKNGSPRHPLYLKNDAECIPWP